MTVTRPQPHLCDTQPHLQLANPFQPQAMFPCPPVILPLLPAQSSSVHSGLDYYSSPLDLPLPVPTHYAPSSQNPTPNSLFSPPPHLLQTTSQRVFVILMLSAGSLRLLFPQLLLSPLQHTHPSADLPRCPLHPMETSPPFKPPVTILPGHISHPMPLLPLPSALCALPFYPPSHTHHSPTPIPHCLPTLRISGSDLVAHGQGGHWVYVEPGSSCGSSFRAGSIFP